MFRLAALKVQAVSGDALANVNKPAETEGQELQSFVSPFCRHENRLLGFIAHSVAKTTKSCKHAKQALKRSLSLSQNGLSRYFQRKNTPAYSDT